MSLYDDYVENVPIEEKYKNMPRSSLITATCKAIFATSLLLQTSIEVPCTACVYVRKFIENEGHLTVHPHFLVQACVMLACKVCEQQRRLRDVVSTAYHLFFGTAETIAFPSNTAYWALKIIVSEVEFRVLASLGFNTVVNLPHILTLDLVRFLELDTHIAVTAYYIVNDSFYTDLPLKCTTNVLALAAILLALNIYEDKHISGEKYLDKLLDSQHEDFSDSIPLKERRDNDLPLKERRDKEASLRGNYNSGNYNSGNYNSGLMRSPVSGYVPVGYRAPLEGGAPLEGTSDYESRYTPGLPYNPRTPYQSKVYEPKSYQRPYVPTNNSSSNKPSSHLSSHYSGYSGSFSANTNNTYKPGTQYSGYSGSYNVNTNNPVNPVNPINPVNPVNSTYNPVNALPSDSAYLNSTNSTHAYNSSTHGVASGVAPGGYQSKANTTDYLYTTPTKTMLAYKTPTKTADVYHAPTYIPSTSTHLPSIEQKRNIYPYPSSQLTFPNSLQPTHKTLTSLNITSLNTEESRELFSNTVDPTHRQLTSFDLGPTESREINLYSLTADTLEDSHTEDIQVIQTEEGSHTEDTDSTHSKKVIHTLEDSNSEDTDSTYSEQVTHTEEASDEANDDHHIGAGVDGDLLLSSTPYSMIQDGTSIEDHSITEKPTTDHSITEKPTTERITNNAISDEDMIQKDVTDKLMNTSEGEHIQDQCIQGELTTEGSLNIKTVKRRLFSDFEDEDSNDSVSPRIDCQNDISLQDNGFETNTKARARKRGIWFSTLGDQIQENSRKDPESIESISNTISDFLFDSISKDYLPLTFPLPVSSITPSSLPIESIPIPAPSTTAPSTTVPPTTLHSTPLHTIAPAVPVSVPPLRLDPITGKPIRQKPKTVFSQFNHPMPPMSANIPPNMPPNMPSNISGNVSNIQMNNLNNLKNDMSSTGMVDTNNTNTITTGTQSTGTIDNTGITSLNKNMTSTGGIIPFNRLEPVPVSAPAPAQLTIQEQITIAQLCSLAGEQRDEVEYAMNVLLDIYLNPDMSSIMNRLQG